MSNPKIDLKELSQKIERELFKNIVPFWLNKTKDTENGGFHGRITHDLQIERDAPKSLILHTRILWSFAYLYGFKQDPAYLEISERAYNFILENFLDKE